MDNPQDWTRSHRIAVFGVVIAIIAAIPAWLPIVLGSGSGGSSTSSTMPSVSTGASPPSTIPSVSAGAKDLAQKIALITSVSHPIPRARGSVTVTNGEPAKFEVRVQGLNRTVGSPYVIWLYGRVSRLLQMTRTRDDSGEIFALIPVPSDVGEFGQLLVSAPSGAPGRLGRTIVQGRLR